MVPIVTPEEMGAVDAEAPEPTEVLIDRAGGAVARAALRMLGGTYGRVVHVIAGTRGSRAVATEKPSASLTISYDPSHLNNPEAMIAVFAHTLAHYLGTSAREPPPGGAEDWPQVTELLAVFLGFGLMFANTALILPRGGCCGGALVQRQAYVSQHDITYALAIFSALKGLPGRDVLAHLKKSLRGHFNQASREVKGRYSPRLQEIARYCGN